jgi:hypothetical protein
MAEEYISQFENIMDIYDINELNNKLDHLKKILIKNQIFLIKSIWDTVWDNNSYLFDYTEEMICKRYTYIIKKRFNIYEIKYNLSNNKIPKKLMYLLYTSELVSYLTISNYSLCISKTNGILKIQCNFLNIEEKNIILNCILEVFPNRYNYNSIYDIITIQLKKY